MMPNVCSFAGCIMAGAPFLSPFLPGAENSTRGMSTEGALRLLAGESLSIEPACLATILAERPELPTDYGRYDPVPVDTLDGILWTPVTDAVYLTPSARCPDLSVYPIHDGVVPTTGASLSREAMRALWGRLLDVTQEVTFRGIVYYPTDHLDSPAWKQRVDSIQDEARQFFAGWHHFVPDAELAEPDGYWAHASQRAKEKLWAEVEGWLR